jgi:transposase InsO family protein
LKPLLDFNDKLHLDGIDWVNSQGKSFHIYHFIDAGSNFHVAAASPASTTDALVKCLQQFWISWAGAPNEMMVDSRPEMNSHDFTEFLQRFNIRCTTTSPEAHWQNEKIERHGSFLQHMLTRIDKEYPIKSYEDLQGSLNQRTHAKNSLSIRHGYAPEVIVFGKHARVPGSVLSDESIPSHEAILREEGSMQPSEFRRMLQIRECARRAFHTADNNDVLRRAATRRSCPCRGQYQPGQWVMIWRSETMKQATWLGPHRVVLQDHDHTIWTTVSGKLFRSAPEHVRPALPEEGEPASPWLPEEITAGQRQISRMQRPEEEIPHPDNHNSSGSNGPNDDNPPQPEPATESQDPPITPNHPSSNQDSTSQPDQEPRTK